MTTAALATVVDVRLFPTLLLESSRAGFGRRKKLNSVSGKAVMTATLATSTRCQGAHIDLNDFFH
jgi:hypothetical protein